MTTFHAIAGKQLPVFCLYRKISQVFRLKKQAQRFLFLNKETFISLTWQKYNKYNTLNKKILSIVLKNQNNEKIFFHPSNNIHFYEQILTVELIKERQQDLAFPQSISCFKNSFFMRQIYKSPLGYTH